MSSPYTPQDLAKMIGSGQRLGLSVDYGGVSMAVIAGLLAGNVTDLDLICVPTGGLQADVLIGTGRVRSIETSAVTLGEAGGAPCFARAIKSGAIDIIDSTCPAIHAGLMAAQKGVPFMPIRGLIGSDILKNRPDWQVINNPMSSDDDPIVIVPAITLDVAVLHCPAADRAGNVWIGRRRELASMAYAAKSTLVTVERIVEDDFFASEEMAAGTLPALYIDAIAVAENGAHPVGLWGEYPADITELRRYAAAAKTGAGFDAYIDEILQKGGW